MDIFDGYDNQKHSKCLHLVGESDITVHVYTKYELSEKCLWHFMYPEPGLVYIHDIFKLICRLFKLFVLKPN